MREESISSVLITGSLLRASGAEFHGCPSESWSHAPRYCPSRGQIGCIFTWESLLETGSWVWNQVFIFSVLLCVWTVHLVFLPRILLRVGRAFR